MESTNASEGGTPDDRRPVRRRQCDRTALSDARLTEAAIELIVRTGIHRTTLQAVGERAGYSRALATHRFGSKAGLFTHVLKTASADWLNRVQQAVGERVGVDALCAATDAGLRFIRERPDEVRAMYMLWFLSIDLVTDYGPNIASVHRAQRRDAEHWIRAGQDAGQIDRRVDAARGVDDARFAAHQGHRNAEAERQQRTCSCQIEIVVCGDVTAVRLRLFRCAHCRTNLRPGAPRATKR